MKKEGKKILFEYFEGDVVFEDELGSVGGNLGRGKNENFVLFEYFFL
jgi:hypothetical protein